MRRTRSICPLVLFMLCLPQVAAAASVRVEQLWYYYLPVSNTIDSSFTAETTGIFDDSAISGSGLEVVPLTYFGMATYQDGVGQHFNRADFPDPPSTTEEGNIVAEYYNDVFQRLVNVSTGGSARILLRNGSLTGDISGSMNIAGDRMIWHLPGSGEWEFRLQTTEVLYPQASVVPLPGAIWLFASAVLGLGWLRRRSAPGARACPA